MISRQKRDSWVGIYFILVLLIPTVGTAAAEDGLSTGQTVYVPAYLHIIYGDIHPRLRAPFKLLHHRCCRSETSIPITASW